MLPWSLDFAGRMDERKKWGYHLPSSWELFFSIGKKIGQITQDIKFEDVCKNDLIDEANAFACSDADSHNFRSASSCSTPYRIRSANTAATHNAKSFAHDSSIRSERSPRR